MSIMENRHQRVRMNMITVGRDIRLAVASNGCTTAASILGIVILVCMLLSLYTSILSKNVFSLVIDIIHISACVFLLVGIQIKLPSLVLIFVGWMVFGLVALIFSALFSFVLAAVPYNKNFQIASIDSTMASRYQMDEQSIRAGLFVRGILIIAAAIFQYWIFVVGRRAYNYLRDYLKFHEEEIV